MARLVSTHNEKKEMRLGTTRRRVRTVKEKSKIDDKIMEARKADASWLKIFDD